MPAVTNTAATSSSKASLLLALPNQYGRNCCSIEAMRPYIEIIHARQPGCLPSVASQRALEITRLFNMLKNVSPHPPKLSPDVAIFEISWLFKASSAIVQEQASFHALPS